MIRFIILVLSLLYVFTGFSQVGSFNQLNAKEITVGEKFYLPVGDTTYVPKRNGALLYRIADEMIYKYVSVAVGPDWTPLISGGGSTYTFSNGLTESAGTVKLRGELTATTSIWGNPFKYSYALSGTDSVAVQTNNNGWRVDRYKTGVANNLIVGADMYFEVNDGSSQSAGLQFFNSFGSMATKFQDSRTVKTGLEYTSHDTTGWTAYTLVSKNYINQRLSAFTPSGGNLINGATNLGSGAQVFKDTSSNKINLRSITATGGMVATQNTNDITISLPTQTGNNGKYLKTDGSTATWELGGTTNSDSTFSRIRRGTFSQRPAVPDTGQIFEQTDRLAGTWKYNGAKWKFLGSVYDYAGFTQFSVASPVTSGGTGSGSTIVQVPGIGSSFKMQTGTSTTGYSTNFLQQTTVATPEINPSIDSVTYYSETYVMFPTLSDGTDTYTFLFGSSTSSTSILYPAFGIKYSSSINSGKFQSVTRQHNGGSFTEKDCGVTVAANTWYKLAYELNGFDKVIRFYINDVLVNTHTSAENIIYNGTPTWGCEVSLYGLGIAKTAGTTNRFFYADYQFSYIVKQKY